MAAVSGTMPGGYSPPKLVDSLCIRQCINGPCTKGNACAQDIEIFSMLKENIITIEEKLQAAGWNGMLRNSPHRLVPVSYQSQVVAVCVHDL